jgi:phenylalanyl-tRNA synthetase alpha subunit
MNKKIEFLKEKMAESLELINNNEFKIVKKNYLGKKGIISSILKETKKKKEENSKEIFIFLSN